MGERHYQDGRGPREGVSGLLVDLLVLDSSQSVNYQEEDMDMADVITNVIFVLWLIMVLRAWAATD
jgi:hypothetical protein